MAVDEWYDGDGKLDLTISWDQEDPVESRFNDWTSEDFLTGIQNFYEQENYLWVTQYALTDIQSYTDEKGEEHFSGICDTSEDFTNLLLAGPAGVGKTSLVTPFALSLVLILFLLMLLWIEVSGM